MLSPYTVTIYTKQDNPYNVIPDAPIEIRERLANGTSGSLSIIYSDQEGLIPITQTGAKADSNGQFVFYAEAAQYNAVYESQTVPVDIGLTADTLPSAIINDLSQTYNFDTLAEAVAADFLVEGKVLALKERTSGNGGGAIWDCVDKTTVIVNGDTIIACTGVPTLALVMRQTGSVRGELNKSYRTVAGVIRNSGAGWFIIDDALHKNVNISSVSSTSTIQVNYNKTFEKITSLIAASDETLAKKGVMVGASVGNSNALIDLTAPISFHVDAATGTKTIDALFSPYIETVATDAHQLVINHPNMVGAPTITGVGGSGRIRGKVSYSSTQTVITEVCDIT